MNDQTVDSLVEAVISELRKKLLIEVEASGRHVHLCRSDVESLFGKGYQLTRVRDLSQPGQFVCQERVSLTGPKGTLSNVVILGPERKETQAEISMTDSLTLGIRPPVRLSGDTQNSPGIMIAAGERKINKDCGVIVAKRHVHLSTEDAKRMQVKNGDSLSLQVYGVRPLIFEDVAARVSDEFATYVHIDYDEANACGFQKGMLARVLKERRGKDG